MSDSFRQIVGRVLLRVPAAGTFLAEDWVRNAYRDLCARRQWSWNRKYGQMLFPAIYNTGTVAVTRLSLIVTGTSTVWDSSMVGRQFRAGNSVPIYTITSVESATSLTLDQPYGGSTATGQSYSIYQAYQTMPDDFDAFAVIYDPAFNYRLNLDFAQGDLDAVDAQRSNSGNAYLSSFLRFSSSQIGRVGAPIQVSGSGPDPGSGGSYTGPADAIFTVEITTGGASGTAVFRWKKDGGSYTSNVTTDAAAAAQDLQDGVSVYFPLAQTYVLGDIWVIKAAAGSNSGNFMYEIWPHIQSEYVLPYYYIQKMPDLSSSVTLPRSIDGNILLEGALAHAAMWPGPSPDRPNPYYRLELSDRHTKNFERLVNTFELNDENISLQDVVYDTVSSWPFAPLPGWADSNWLMKHDI